jgi:transposase-like protein
MNYPKEYRKQILQRLLKSDSLTVNELSLETGIGLSTLYEWIKVAKNGSVCDKEKNPKKWSLQDKFQTILKARKKSDIELGQWLRELGLTDAHLKKWETEISQSFTPKTNKQSRLDAKKIIALQKDHRKKSDALAEVSALLILKKKFDAFMSGEDIPL